MDEIELWAVPDQSLRIGDGGTEFAERFCARGTENRAAVLTEVLLNPDIVPTEINGVPRVDLDIRLINGHTDAWDIDVLYSQTPGSTLTPSAIGDEVVTFSTGGGGTRRVYHAIEHLGDFAPEGQEPANYKGAINVTPDGVEGVDIPNPQFSLVIDRVFPSEVITQLFLRGVNTATGAVNSRSFRGYNPGELFLTNVEGGPQNDESWRITYEMLGIPNALDVEIGDPTDGGIAVGPVDGHDFLWVEYEPQVVNEGEDNAYTNRKVIGAHLERVFPRVDFAALTGLPG